VARAPAGPYLVSVWTQPDPPRVGQIDVSVAVMASATGEAILDARAAIRADARDAVMSTPAKTLDRGGGGNRLLYRALVDAPAAGRWAMPISVTGPLGSGETAFEIDVRRGLPIAWLLMAGGITLTLAALAWRRLSRGAGPANVVAATVASLLTAALVTAAAGQTFDRARYRPQTIATLVREHPRQSGMVIVPDVPIRTAAVYSGAFRPLSGESRQLLTRWADVMRVDVSGLFRQELRVDEAGATHWLPVQSTLVSHMTSELKAGDTIELFLIYVGQAGGRHILLVNAFTHGDPTPPAGSAPAR